MAFEEKRAHKRDKISSETKIVSSGRTRPDDLNCLACDISEGGIKILTDRQPVYEKYSIIMFNQKFPVKVIYRSETEDNHFLTGLSFLKPISDMLKKEIIVNLNKRSKK